MVDDENEDLYENVFDSESNDSAASQAGNAGASKIANQTGYPVSKAGSNTDKKGNLVQNPGQEPEPAQPSPKWFENSSDYTEYDEVRIDLGI